REGERQQGAAPGGAAAVRLAAVRGVPGPRSRPVLPDRVGRAGRQPGRRGQAGLPGLPGAPALPGLGAAALPGPRHLGRYHRAGAKGAAHGGQRAAAAPRVTRGGTQGDAGAGTPAGAAAKSPPPLIKTDSTERTLAVTASSSGSAGRGLASRGGVSVSIASATPRSVPVRLCTEVAEGTGAPCPIATADAVTTSMTSSRATTAGHHAVARRLTGAGS